MAMLKPLPDPGLPWVNPETGRPMPPFAEYMQSLNLVARGANIRETLTAARDYYVRADGNDNNTGLADNAGGAFLTIQAAVDHAATLDLVTFSVTIHAGAGTFAAVTLKSYVGVGPITIVGDATTPANVVVGTITADGVIGKWILQGLKTPTILAINGSIINITGKMEYGAAAIHIAAGNSSAVSISADYKISGGGSIHYFASDTSAISLSAGLTVTVTGTPAFALAFAYADGPSIIRAGGLTFSGGATGRRYFCDFNAAIYTAGGGPNYFPGDAAGLLLAGGEYL